MLQSASFSTDNPYMAGAGCWNSYWFMALLSLLIGCAGLIAITFIYLRKADNTQVQQSGWHWLVITCCLVCASCHCCDLHLPAQSWQHKGMVLPSLVNLLLSCLCLLSSLWPPTFTCSKLTAQRYGPTVPCESPAVLFVLVVLIVTYVYLHETTHKYSPAALCIHLLSCLWFLSSLSPNCRYSPAAVPCNELSAVLLKCLLSSLSPTFTCLKLTTAQVQS